MARSCERRDHAGPAASAQHGRRPLHVLSGSRVPVALQLGLCAAQQEFVLHQREHPQDPLGPTSEAVGVLFAELNRLGILDSAFFKDSSRTALVQRRSVAALHNTKDATNSAQLLLAVCTACYDAYVATGISRYLIGPMSAPASLVVRLVGFEGNRKRGITDLQRAAEQGHYLAPFARIVLAIVYAREKDPESARQVLAQLHSDFPRNPLFVREIARLDSGDGRGVGR